MSADDGSGLLTSPAVAPLLETAVSDAGGRLVSWVLDHVDAQPGYSTTATYTAFVDWPYGRREELLGVSARVGGLAPTDGRADIYQDGERTVAVWIYPRDPDLPGLASAAYAESMAAVFNDYGVFGRRILPEEITLDMIGYRPRRRAVLRVQVAGDPPTTLYVKVMREKVAPEVKLRHDLLLAAGVPAPEVLVATPTALLVLAEAPGKPLARALFDPEDPCTAEQMIEMLDAMPPSLARLERRPPWSDAVAHYSQMVASAMPSLAGRLKWMTDRITEGLATIPPGDEPTHGDFHEGQLHVAGGRIVGVLDVDTIGPGRRADDLACMIAHLSTIQRMNAEQAARVHHLIRTWVPVFDERVDPIELRLRAAGVIISLATGPYRGQEPTWQRDTLEIVDAAEALVRQVC